MKINTPAPSLDLPVLPIFTEPMREHSPARMSWSETARWFAPFREHYMQHFDSPERRLADKNPKRFRLG